MTMKPMNPKTEHQYNDCAVGRAWRHCVELLPDEWTQPPYAYPRRQVRLLGPSNLSDTEVLYSADILRSDGDIESMLFGLGHTALEALEGLARMLKERREKPKITRSTAEIAGEFARATEALGAVMSRMADDLPAAIERESGLTNVTIEPLADRPGYVARGEAQWGSISRTGGGMLDAALALVEAVRREA